MVMADQGVIHPETHCNKQCGGGDVSPKSLSKMEFRIWSFNELRITFVDRLLEDIQDAKLQLMNKIDAIDFWKQMRIAYVSRLFEDIQDAKLQYLSIYNVTLRILSNGGSSLGIHFCAHFGSKNEQVG